MRDGFGWFDAVVVVNLDQRRDRLDRISFQLANANLDVTSVRRVRGVNGSVLLTPGWWCQGQGAWGCLRSHVRILQKAIALRLESILILEDDALLAKDFAERLGQFMRRVPSDWDAIYLGGQHLEEPTTVNEAVVRCSNVNRTHAHGMRREYMQKALQAIQCATVYINNPEYHVDHVLGQLHRSCKVFAPRTFIVGQDESTSDIAGGRQRVRYWDESPRSNQLAADVVVYSEFGLPAAFAKLIRRATEHRSMTSCQIQVGVANPRHYSDLLRAARRAQLVVVWDELGPTTSWLRDYCGAWKIPCVTCKEGGIPRDSAVLMSRAGAEIAVCSEGQIQRARALCGVFRRRVGHEWRGDERGPVVALLDRDQDYALAPSSPFGSAQEFVRFVEEHYARQEIVFVPPRRELIDWISFERGKVTSCDAYEAMASSSRVVGFTAARLAEAAAIGCPIHVIMGVEPQAREYSPLELVAECLSQQLSIDSRPEEFWRRVVDIVGLRHGAPARDCQTSIRSDAMDNDSRSSLDEWDTTQSERCLWGGDARETGGIGRVVTPEGWEWGPHVWELVLRWCNEIEDALGRLPARTKLRLHGARDCSICAISDGWAAGSETEEVTLVAVESTAAVEESGQVFSARYHGLIAGCEGLRYLYTALFGMQLEAHAGDFIELLISKVDKHTPVNVRIISDLPPHR